MRRWLAIIALALLAPGVADRALAATQPPVKVVAHLSFIRESKAVASVGARLSSVRCARTGTPYIYVCNFAGVAKDGKKVCAATYVHDKPGNTGRYRVNFWGQSWPCGTQPPIAPPAYPGDSGPRS